MNKTPKMVNFLVKMRAKDTLNSLEFIQIEANIVNSFSRFLIGYLEHFDS